MGRIPHAHFRGEFLRRNPEGDELCTWRKSRSLEKLAENKKNSECPCKRRRRTRQVGRTIRKQCRDLRRETERQIYERTEEKPKTKKAKAKAEAEAKAKAEEEAKAKAEAAAAAAAEAEAQQNAEDAEKPDAE